MKKIIYGKKIPNKSYDFRETCFGICEKNGKMLLVNKNGQYSFIGGGVEKGESKQDCLKREFLEESGLTIKSIKELITVDCFWLAAGKWTLESLANFYVVEVEDVRQQPTEEGHILEEVPIEKVGAILPLPYHKCGLKYYLENKTYKNNL